MVTGFNRNVNKGRVGKTGEPGRYLNDVRAIDKIIHNNGASQKIQMEIQKNAKKTNKNESTKWDNRSERKCKEDALKKYCLLNVQGFITMNQPQEKVELSR